MGRGEWLRPGLPNNSNFVFCIFLLKLYKDECVEIYFINFLCINFVAVEDWQTFRQVYFILGDITKILYQTTW